MKEMKKHGVEIHYLRNPEKLYSKGEALFFDGFVVHDPNRPDAASEDLKEEDTRVFEPYEEVGTLSFHTNDRFFASTSKPLPEGLCGAPALDADGELCGVVEGIVPVDHENQNIAGSAAFLPSFVLASFIDYAERYMLEQMMPKDVFQDVVKAKATNTLGGGSVNVEGSPEGGGEGGWEEAYERQIELMKKQYSKEEVDAILWNVKVRLWNVSGWCLSLSFVFCSNICSHITSRIIQREREEVLKIMNEEGGDMGETIERVRAKTLAMREQAIEEYKKGNIPAKDADESDNSQGKA